VPFEDNIVQQLLHEYKMMENILNADSTPVPTKKIISAADVEGDAVQPTNEGKFKDLGHDVKSKVEKTIKEEMLITPELKTALLSGFGDAKTQGAAPATEATFEAASPGHSTSNVRMHGNAQEIKVRRGAAFRTQRAVMSHASCQTCFSREKCQKRVDNAWYRTESSFLLDITPTC
jgi:hypothetical protein